MEDKNRLDRYWRLDDYKGDGPEALKPLVVRAGFNVSPRPSKGVLVNRLHRLARGALIYDKCSTAEIQGFLAARGLHEPEKRDLAIRALHRADDEAQFPRFLELPPELRNRVYDFYFATMPTRMRPGVQAPITRASKLLRSETLPNFYGGVTLELRFSLRIGRRRSYALIPTNDVTLSLGQTSDTNLGFLRKVRITIIHDNVINNEGDDPQRSAGLTLDIERKSGGSACTLMATYPAFAQEPGSAAKFEQMVVNKVDEEGGLSSQLIYSVREKLASFLW